MCTEIYHTSTGCSFDTSGGMGGITHALTSRVAWVASHTLAHTMQRHIHTHVHTRARTHTPTSTHTHTCRSDTLRVASWSLPCSVLQLGAHTHARTHTRTHRHAHTHTHLQVRHFEGGLLKPALQRLQLGAHTHTHTCTHTCTHAHTPAGQTL